MPKLKLFKTESTVWFYFILSHIPGYTGIFLRRLVYSHTLQSCGTNLIIGMGCKIKWAKNISIGNNFLLINASLSSNNELKIGNNVRIYANTNIGSDNGTITIGNDVSIGPNCMILASNHSFASTDIPIRYQETKSKYVIIGSDVWIGANVIILPGLTIGDGAVIGAGSVVTHDVQAYTIVAGNTARVINTRKQSKLPDGK